MTNTETTKNIKAKKTAKQPSVAALNLRAKKSLTKLLSLHETIEASSDKKQIAISLIEQKRIMNKLRTEASQGNAIMGLAMMKGMIITGINFSSFFDYTAPYTDNRYFEKIEELAKLETLAPLLKEYRTIEKADSIIPFVQHLPNLNKIPFSVELFETLNNEQEDKTSFQQDLFQRFNEEYNEAPAELKPLIQNILKTAVYKGYPQAALLYSDIETGKTKSLSIHSINMLKSVQSNRFSSTGQRMVASQKLAPVLKPIKAKNKLVPDRSNSL